MDNTSRWFTDILTIATRPSSFLEWAWNHLWQGRSFYDLWLIWEPLVWDFLIGQFSIHKVILRTLYKSPQFSEQRMQQVGALPLLGTSRGIDRKIPSCHKSCSLRYHRSRSKGYLLFNGMTNAEWCYFTVGVIDEILASLIMVRSLEPQLGHRRACLFFPTKVLALNRSWPIFRDCRVNFIAEALS